MYQYIYTHIYACVESGYENHTQNWFENSFFSEVGKYSPCIIYTIHVFLVKCFLNDLN